MSARRARRSDGQQRPESAPSRPNPPPGSLSPCSRVDQAVLGYLRGREGGDWADAYCASLAHSFRALPAHFVPKMKVAVETLFEAALGPNPTEECFWMLTQWSLHGRDRYPSRGTYSWDPTARAVNPVEPGPEPVLDFSPLLEGLRSPITAPITANQAATQPAAAQQQSSENTVGIHEPSCPGNALTARQRHNSDTDVPHPFQTVHKPKGMTTPTATQRSVLCPTPPRVKLQRRTATRTSSFFQQRHGWETTSSEEELRYSGPRLTPAPVGTAGTSASMAARSPAIPLVASVARLRAEASRSCFNEETMEIPVRKAHCSTAAEPEVFQTKHFLRGYTHTSGSLSEEDAD
ncbi:uncharacterized protein [Eleutherodactylus coqui]